MRKQFISLFLVGIMVFTSLTVFAGTSDQVSNNTVSNAYSASFFASNNFFEYCTVDLDNPRSNLNVRTWEGRIVGKLKHGTTVFVNEYSGDWARVSVKRGRRWVSIGWVDSSYLLC